MKVSLWESGVPAERFQHTTGVKNLILDALKRVRTVSLHLHHSVTTEVHQLSAKKLHLSPVSPMRKSESIVSE